MKKLSTFSTSQLNKLVSYEPASQEIWEPNSITKLKLDWNEGVVEPPSKFKEIAINTIQEEIFRYYPNVKNNVLIETIASFVGCNVGNIAYFSGIDSLHEYIAKAFLEEGDKVILLSPTYDNFRAVCDLSECELEKISFFNQESYPEFKFNAKIVYFANPNNPTGEFIGTKNIELMLSLNPNTLFVIDEAYIEFGGESSAQLVSKYKNLLICRTLSKAFCLAGIRFGYCIACDEIINSLEAIKNPKSITMLSQRIAIHAFTNPDYMYENVAKTLEGKEILTKKIHEKFKDIKILGEKGNFLLLIFNNNEDHQNLIKALMAKGVFIRDCSKLIDYSCRITVPPIDKIDYLINCFE